MVYCLFKINTYYRCFVIKHLFSLKKRSNLLEVFCKKGVLRNLAKFTGKHLCQSFFFWWSYRPEARALLKKRPWHKCFLVNFAKFLTTPFLTEHLRWLLLKKLISKGLHMRGYKLHKQLILILLNTPAFLFSCHTYFRGGGYCNSYPCLVLLSFNELCIASLTCISWTANCMDSVKYLCR